jgi:hypothetical protein
MNVFFFSYANWIRSAIPIGLCTMTDIDGLLAKLTQSDNISWLHHALFLLWVYDCADRIDIC